MEFWRLCLIYRSINGAFLATKVLNHRVTKRGRDMRWKDGQGSDLHHLKALHQKVTCWEWEKSWNVTVMISSWLEFEMVPFVVDWHYRQIYFIYIDFTELSRVLNATGAVTDFSWLKSFDLFSSLNIIRLITGDRMRLAGLEKRMGKKRIACAVL